MPILLLGPFLESNELFILFIYIIIEYGSTAVVGDGRKKTWPPYSMYYQLTPHKSTTFRFSVAFVCLQSFLHAFLNAKTCYDALQPSQSG